MLKKLNKLKIFVITILVGMVFAVNVGYTFALDSNASKVTLAIEVDSKEESKSYTYLNDVVVNNSTIQIPIGYTLGTVSRDINFDYSFAEPTDIVVTYEMSYTDGTEPSNVILNVVNRDDYIWDQETVMMENYTNSYDASSGAGTLYYLGSLSGVGNQKLFSGVTFLKTNDEVQDYKATQNVVLGKSEYNAGNILTSLNYQQTQLEMARYWDAYTLNNVNQAVNYICNTKYTMGGVTIPAGVIMSAANYNSYINGGAGEYSVSYVVAKEFSTYSIGDVLSFATVDALSKDDRSKINITCTRTSAFWTQKYQCTTEYAVDGRTYRVNDLISVAEYENLVTNDSDCGTKFQSCYECLTGYLIQANENIISKGNSIAAGTVITAKEYQDLLSKEQICFEANTYKVFQNKNLTIDVKVYTKLTAEKQKTGETLENYNLRLKEYYDEDRHYFKDFKSSTDGKAFKYWIEYKSSSLTENHFMIYNAHSRYETGIPYATNFALGQDLTKVVVDENPTSNLISSYIYKEGTDTNGEEELYYYSYAGGNKYNAGIGVYYLTTSKVELTVKASINWYNSNGEKVSSMPINNVKLKYPGTDGVAFSKVIDAGKYGYLNILEYIQTTTEGNLFDMTGYSLVVSSVAVVATSHNGTVASDAKEVAIIDSTSYNPLLYSYYNDLGTATFKPVNITISNNTDQAIRLPNIKVSPSFTAYNGSNAIGDGGFVYGVAKTITPVFSIESSTTLNGVFSSATQSHFTFDANLWECSKSGDEYTFTSSGGYLAPHTSITVISGIVTPGYEKKYWSIPSSAIDQNGGTYYADYWFEVGASLESNSATNETTFAATTSYHSAEIITYLNSTKITTTAMTEVYIGLRNNTSQKMTKIEYSGRLQLGDNYNNQMTDCTSVSYLSEEATEVLNNFTVSSSSIALMPGESIIICKLVIGSGQENVFLTESSVTCTLAAGKASSSGVYFKRDYASGNLSIINGGADTKLDVDIGEVSNTTLVGGASKWNSSLQYIMQDTVDADGNAKTASLAMFRQNQMINLLTNYYTKIGSIGWRVPA